MITQSLTSGLALLAGILYALLALAVARGWKRLPLAVTIPPGSGPSVSVVIVCRDEALHLPGLLEDLLRLNYPCNKLEIILIDDDSGDNTMGLMLAFRDKHPNRNIQVKSSKNGKKQALQVNTPLATGEWVLFTDGDCQLPPDWIRSMVAAALANGSELVLGPVSIRKDNTFPSRFQFIESQGLMAITAGFAGLGKPFMGNGANMLVNKAAYLHCTIPGASAKYASGDDVFLIQGMLAAGGRHGVVFNASPAAVVITAAPSRWQDLLWQKVRWASKARSGTSMLTLLVGFVVMLANTIPLFVLAASFSEPRCLAMLPVYFLLKTWLDLWMIRRVKKLQNEAVFLSDFLFCQFIYPLYLILVFLLSLSGKYYWKGRNLS